MLDQRRVAAQPDEKREQSFREQLFIERYDGLHAWALHLTQHWDSADDLVQEAFVQWVLSRTRLEEIENIDGYLRTMLRNMHISRVSRTAQHLHETALSIADYDSFRLGWTAIEPPRRMQASEDLHNICAYACSRKESSKAGSVLILRFFHDYLPSEIAGVLNNSRNCVDQWQRLARREAKLFLKRPGRLRFVNSHSPTRRHSIRYLGSDCDLMLDLRQMIFDSCHGECISRQELEEVYSQGHAGALTTTALAHLVSCSRCLDSVNYLLGFPLLSARYQAEPCEPKDPPHDRTGNGASGGGTENLSKKFERKLRETREHKPQELRISVNGFRVSSLTVSSELSELNLNLSPDEPIEFVEVSSEQGVQLLFFSINPEGSQPEQWAWIELSEGRSLEVCFRSESGSSLHVVYNDPAPEEASSTGEIFNSNGLSSPLAVVADVPAEPGVGTHGRVFRLRSWAERLAGTLRIAKPRALVARETTTRSTVERLVESLDHAPGRIQSGPFLNLLTEAIGRNRAHSRLRFGLLIGLLCAAVVAGFLFFKANLSRELSATELLERATHAERLSQTSPDHVRHQSINFEERRGAERAIVAQRKLEIWENEAKGQRTQRLYDDSNRVIAGVWRKTDGSRTLYHHGSKLQSQPALVSPDSLLLNLEDIWQFEPSARLFSALVGDPAAVTVEERSVSYILSYAKDRPIGASHLLKATLTLRKSDLHPVELMLLVQRGNELHEYRFAEAAHELLPENAVAPSVFEIGPELTGGAGELGRPGDWALRDLTASRVPPLPSTSAPPIASAELEVDVAYLLNSAKADRNEQVTLTRSAGGSLRVEGVVESEQRKEEFVRALALVSNNPAVRIEIRTVAEAMKRPMSASTALVQEAEETPNTVAADDQLRTYFERRNPDGPIDEAIRSYSSRMVYHAYQATFHAIEMKRLVNRFASVDMRTVAPDARTKWLAMLHQHAAAFEREIATLQQELQPVFLSGTSLPGADDVSIQTDAELTGVVERLHKLALSNNDGIRAAFTISSHSSAAALKSAAFWQSLQRSANLAKRIEQYQTRNN
jgi:RNA polymerase sigma factor (sigma-70 family)